MEFKLDKRYPLPVSPDAAWRVLSDVRATAACLPGAQITEQLDERRYKGVMKAKVGPATMNFAGEVEVQSLDADVRTLRMLGKGADKAGSSASMQLSARLEAADDAGASRLVGEATVVVSGKLAQFGSRLLVPVSDALLAQFVANFAEAAAASGEPAAPVAAPTTDATPTGSAPPAAVGSDAVTAATEPPAHAMPMNAGAAPTGATPAPAAAGAATQPPSPVAPAPRELNAVALLWSVFKGWLAGLFGRRSGD